MNSIENIMKLLEDVKINNIDFGYELLFLILFLIISYFISNKDKRLNYKLLFNFNSIFNILLWIFVIYKIKEPDNSYKFDNLYYLLLPLLITIITDILRYQQLITNIPIKVLDDKERIEHYYSWMKSAAKDQYGKGIDLGFNYYNGDYSKTKKQAQIDKFNYAFKKLKLVEGCKVMDIGCGQGDWLEWLQNKKKCTVVGVNITKAQADVVNMRGIKCINISWQNLHKILKNNTSHEYKKFIGYFDCVTCWDTIEHYMEGSDIYNFEKRKVYTNLFELAHILLDKKSNIGTVWSSTLHIWSDLSRNIL